jgi:hypothetical protein
MTSFENIKRTKWHPKKNESITNLWNKKSFRRKIGWHTCASNWIQNIDLICCDFPPFLFVVFCYWFFLNFLKWKLCWSDLKIENFLSFDSWNFNHWKSEEKLFWKFKNFFFKKKFKKLQNFRTTPLNWPNENLLNPDKMHQDLCDNLALYFLSFSS